MTNKKNTWLIAILLLTFFGGLIALWSNRPGSVSNLGISPPELPNLESGNVAIDTSDPAQQIPNSDLYITTGKDAADDNFFIAGRVESLASLADTSKQATIVWVSASWCEICHIMRRFVATSANKYATKVALKEIDYDSNPEIVRDQAIRGTPAFFVLDKNGSVVSRFGGANQSNFEAHLERASQLQSGIN